LTGVGRPLRSRLAGRVRRSLGADALAARLDAVEQTLAGLAGPRYPSGPVYLGDYQALVATRWGAKLVVDTRDYLLAPWLLLDGLWESHVTGWMQSTLAPGAVFVDVGANIGYFTLLGAQLVGKRGRVVAVEAHPDLAELLRRNVVMNGGGDVITVSACAAWSQPARLRFHQRVHYAANSSVGSFGPEGLARLDDTELVVDVEAIRLDDLLEGLPRVDVIKVDVEGAEVRAFTGLERTLNLNSSLTVMFEWSPAQLLQLGDTPEALLDLLSGHGLQFRLLEADLAPIERGRLLELDYGNVVARRPAH
jgi:FkbM family methyltransferase